MKKHQEVLSFLQAHKWAVLSTVSPEGEPSGATIYYTVNDNLDLFFLTHTQSQKYKNFTHSGKAALTITDNSAQSTVQAFGPVQEVEIGDEHDQMFQQLARITAPDQDVWVPPVAKLSGEGTQLFKLHPEKMKFSQFTPEAAHSAHIETILP